MSTSPRTLVCTICSANYLAQARVLMASLARTQPDWERHVLIVDEIGERFDPAVENFAVVEIADLPIPEKRKFFFRYGILELNTAVFPRAFNAWDSLAEANMTLGNIEDALVYYQTSLDLNAGNDNARAMIERIHAEHP